MEKRANIQGFNVDLMSFDEVIKAIVCAINDEKNNSLYLKYKELADQENNVIFGGRLAEYKYYDMHHIVEKALNYFL